MRALSREQNLYLSLYADKIHTGHCMGLKMDVNPLIKARWIAFTVGYNH